MPELILEGSARERGTQHGETLREQVNEGLDRWRELVAARGQNPDRRVIEIAERSPYVGTLQSRCPDLLDEVRGIAEGAAVTFAEALVLNLMDEEWWFRDGEESGCSLVAGRPAGARAPVLAQNMDLPTWMEDLQVVLRIRHAGEDAGTERVVLSAAGMIGLTGARGGGVAVGVNTLLQLPRSLHGVPVAFVVRSVLEHPSAESAAGWLAAMPHSSGQHYAIVDDHQVIGVECSAAGAALRHFAPEEWLLHTNHPLWSDPSIISPPEAVGIVGVRLHSSHRRFDALTSFEQTARHAPADAIAAMLANESSGVCMVATEQYPTSTFGSVQFSPGSGRYRVAPGSPAHTPWQEYSAVEGHVI